MPGAPPGDVLRLVLGYPMQITRVFVADAALLAVLACAAPTAPGPSEVVAPEPPAELAVRWCERRDATRFACATVTLPTDRFAAEQSCNGLAFETPAGSRCLQYDSVTVAETPFARPPAVGECGVWCGDRDGDQRYDRCLERLLCPERAREKEFSAHYAVVHPLGLLEQLCAPLPETVRGLLEASRAGQGDCDQAPLFWVISPETMKHASDQTGPGLCYGVVQDEARPTEKESCGQHHCQTLRYCDGRERPTHCTVYAECRAGRLVPLRLGW